MEASAHTPAAQALPHMARTPEPSPATAVSSDTADVRAAGRTRIRDQVAENPLMTLFGTVLVALLMFNFTVTHSRIGDTNDRISDTNDRIGRLEDRVARLEERVTRFEERVDARFQAQNAKMDRLFEAQDAKIERLFEAQDAKIDEISLKLTALIAVFNATAEVDAALEGRLLDEPEAAD